MFNRKNRIENMDSYVEERLSEYLDGTLSAQDRALVEDYLAKSQEARASLESLRYTVDLLKQTPAPALPRQFTLPVTSRAPAQGAPSWLVWSLRGVAVAATAAFVILLTATLLNQPNNLQTASAPSAAAQPSIVVAFAQTPLATIAAPAPALENSASTPGPLMVTVPAPTETQEFFAITTTPELQPTEAPAQAQDSAPASAPEQPTEIAITALAAPTMTPDDTVARSSAAGSAPAAATSVPATPTGAFSTQRKVTTQDVSGVVTTDDLHVRRGPGTEYDSLGVLKRDERLIILGRSLNNLWLLIRYPKSTDTGIGWVGARFIKLTAPINTLPIFQAPPFIQAELTPTLELPSPTPTSSLTATPTATETPLPPLEPADETSEPVVTPTPTGN